MNISNTAYYYYIRVLFFNPFFIYACLWQIFSLLICFMERCITPFGVQRRRKKVKEKKLMEYNKRPRQALVHSRLPAPAFQKAAILHAWKRVTLFWQQYTRHQNQCAAQPGGSTTEEQRTPASSGIPLFMLSLNNVIPTHVPEMRENLRGNKIAVKQRES